jgi:PAS domain S-box-containing protein
MRVFSTWSIRKNLTFLVLISILPALAIMLYSGLNRRQVIIADAQHELVLLAHTMAEVQRNMTRSARQMASTLAVLPQIQTLDIQGSSKLFHSVLQGNPDYLNITLVGLAGDVLASGQPFSNANFGDRKHFRSALATKDFAVGEYIETRLGKKTSAFPFAYPVLDSMGNPQAVLTITLDLSVFASFHNLAILPEQSFISIIDHQGLRLFFSPAQESTNPIGKPIKAAAWQRSQGADESGLYAGIGSDGVRRIFAFEKVRLHPDEPPYAYTWASVTEQYLITPANVDLSRNLLLMLLTALVVFVLAWIVSRKTFIVPINNLIAMTQDFAAGNLQLPRKQLETNSELGQLTQAFYTMAYDLKNATQEWTFAMDFFEDAIYILDKNRHLIRANATFYQWLKITPEQAVGRHIANIIHPEGEKNYYDVCLAQEGQRDFTIIMEADNVENPTGMPLEINGKIMHDLEGEYSGLLMNLRDLTNSRLNEQQLRASELKFRLFADYTFDWESWIGPTGEYVYISPACERITGYSPQSFMANKDLLFKLIRDDFKDIIHQHYHEENITKVGTVVVEFPIIDKNGQQHWIEHHCFAVFDEQGHFAGRRINNRDITESKEAEEQRLALEAQINQKRKMEAVGYMAGGMAHNFNNNLSIILGNVELAQMLESTNSEVAPLLENAKIAVRRSRDLVRQIITYSRKGVHNKVPTQLTTIIDETIELLRSTLPTSVNLEKIYSPDWYGQVINGDPSQIQEVLINLCNNAVQAMDEDGELTLTLESVDLRQQDLPAQYDCQSGSYAKLSVQDSGCGMPAEMLDKIFDPFYTTKAEYEGAGMGLSTVQGIVAQHGGAIKVRSSQNHGTTFELYFPLIEGTLIEEVTPEDVALPRGTERILFVDDDEMLAQIGEQLLSSVGYQVTSMTDSAAALKMFAENADSFDLVITDQTMPNLSGVELIRQLKEIRADIPTILCTGYSSKVNEAEAEALGIEAFMMKPLVLPEMLTTIRRVLE